MNWRSIRESLYRSSWITESWDWLMRLCSLASEAILTVTIMYSTIQIFVATDPRVNLVMFIAQQVGLDAGGLGMIKLSNQAKKDGNPAGAKKARGVAITLMVIMMVGVIVNDIESKITATSIDGKGHHVTLDFAHGYPQAAMIIEIVLLIVRSVMAVYYGFAIHDLASQTKHQAMSQQDIEQKIAEAIKNLPHPSVDPSAISAQIFAQIQPDFQAIFSRISALENGQNSAPNWPEIERFFEQKIEAKLADFLPETQPDFAPEIEQDFCPEIEEKPVQILPRITKNLAEKKERNTGPIVAPEKLSGMSPKEAAKLPICQRKKINSRRILQAISGKELRTFSDGSLSKNAVENWAKSLEVLSEKSAS